MLIDEVLLKMIAFDAGDERRIQHFIKVHAFARLIGHEEGLSPDVQERLELAAILHDIGIHAAEEKYGSSAGKYQEIEGPAPARDILASCGVPAEEVERICFLIAHHHTYTDVNGVDWQILLEADFLVNAFEDGLSAQAVETFGQKVFRTASSRRLLAEIYGAPSDARA